MRFLAVNKRDTHCCHMIYSRGDIIGKGNWAAHNGGLMWMHSYAAN